MSNLSLEKLLDEFNMTAMLTQDKAKKLQKQVDAFSGGLLQSGDPFILLESSMPMIEQTVAGIQRLVMQMNRIEADIEDWKVRTVLETNEHTSNKMQDSARDTRLIV